LLGDEDLLDDSVFDGHDDLFDSTANGGEPKDEDDDEVYDITRREQVRMRVREMEEEAAKLKQLQNTIDHQMVSGHLSTSLNNAAQAASNATITQANLTPEAKADADGRSVYVGNVDYGATAEELEMHFHGCGSINRVTILCNKPYGHPKGFAYIEFAEKDSVSTAVAMDESLFRGRQIKVSVKRTNRPGLSSRGGGPPVRSFRARGTHRGGFQSRGFRPTRRGRGGFRRPGFHPY